LQRAYTRAALPSFDLIVAARWDWIALEDYVEKPSTGIDIRPRLYQKGGPTGVRKIGPGCPTSDSCCFGEGWRGKVADRQKHLGLTSRIFEVLSPVLDKACLHCISGFVPVSLAKVPGLPLSCDTCAP
jgi:hypothetical protein